MFSSFCKGESKHDQPFKTFQPNQYNINNKFHLKYANLLQNQHEYWSDSAQTRAVSKSSKFFFRNRTWGGIAYIFTGHLQISQEYCKRIREQSEISVKIQHKIKQNVLDLHLYLVKLKLVRLTLNLKDLHTKFVI